VADKAVKVRVHGVVQGVFFRVAARDAARRLGVAGWVRNRRDGSVEGLFQGPAEAVDALLAWCRHGPPGAVVEHVDTEPAGRDERFAAGLSVIKEVPD
jgi:acylphosphatase